MCVCACVRACVYVSVCVSLCKSACVRPCVRACVRECVWEYSFPDNTAAAFITLHFKYSHSEQKSYVVDRKRVFSIIF